MAESPVLTPDELKTLYLKNKAKHSPFVSRLEESADKEFVATIEIGSEKHNISYRKLRAGEVAYFQRLPFYHKLLADPSEKLTDDEQAKFEAMCYDLVDLAVLPQSKAKWEKLSADRGIVLAVWRAVAYSSGLDASFKESLDDFLGEDIGFNYGWLWLNVLHKTPSEVASLPASDVIFINSWAEALGKRSKKP